MQLFRSSQRTLREAEERRERDRAWQRAGAAALSSLSVAEAALGSALELVQKGEASKAAKAEARER